MAMTPEEMIGANIRALRKRRGLMQEDVAWRAQLHRTQISLLETGAQMPRVLTVLKVAGALEATPNDILAGVRWNPAKFLYGGLVVGEDER